MSARNLIFSDSSDDEGARNRSGDSSGILVKSSLPPSGPSIGGREKAPLKEDIAGSRGSSSSQLRHSANRLSSRVSRKNSKGSGGGSGKPLVTSSFNFAAWVGGAAQTTVTVVEQALVQAFKGESYMGTCLAAISVPHYPVNAAGSSPTSNGSATAGEAPSLVVEDSKGVLLCKLSLATAVLTQDPQRPQYVYVEEGGPAPAGGNSLPTVDSVLPPTATTGEPSRWTLMFQGQQEVAKFFVSSTTALAASRSLLWPCQQGQKAVTLFQSSSSSSSSTSRSLAAPPTSSSSSALSSAATAAAAGAAGAGAGPSLAVRQGCEVHVSYTLWRLEHVVSSPTTSSPAIRVSDVVEDVPREAGVKVTVGDGAWIRGLEEALVGMTPGSVKVICFPAAAYTDFTAAAAAAAAHGGQGLHERRPSSSVRRSVLGSTGSGVEPHAVLAAWVSCIHVSPAAVAATPKGRRDTSKRTASQPHVHRDPVVTPRGAVPAPQNLQETLASIQQQIASLQQCVTQISATASAGGEEGRPTDSMGRSASSSVIGAEEAGTPPSGNVTGLDQTIMVAPRRRSKTPMARPRHGSSCSSATAGASSVGAVAEAEAAMAQSCARSLKHLCNDIYREVEIALSSSGGDNVNGDEEMGSGEGLILSEEDRKRVLHLIAGCIHRQGHEYVQRWKRRAARVAASPIRDSGRDAATERSPPPCVPRELSTYTPLRHVTDTNILTDGRKIPGTLRTQTGGGGRCLSGSSQMAAAAPSLEIDDAGTEGSCSVFRTPPPRAAMRLGSQDYRCSPTPPPLHFD